VPRAILADAQGVATFYYYGIDCVHQLCSGDLALALDVVKRIFADGGVSAEKQTRIADKVQHKTISQFSHQEVTKLRYILPHGDKIFDIVANLGRLARTFAVGKRSTRRDNAKGMPDEPSCRTHLDVRYAALQGLQGRSSDLYALYGILKSRAILFPLETSRSRIEGQTERLQLRRVYLPAFKSPLKRDTPIKVDTSDELVSLLQDPRTFVERELGKAALTADDMKSATSGTNLSLFGE